MSNKLDTLDFSRVNEKEDRWLSPDSLYLEYGFSKSSQAKMRMASNSSTLPFSKIGTKFIRYSKFAIDKWLEDHQVQGNAYNNKDRS